MQAYQEWSDLEHKAYGTKPCMYTVHKKKTWRRYVLKKQTILRLEARKPVITKDQAFLLGKATLTQLVLGVL